jgi:hypothetical protein
MNRAASNAAPLRQRSLILVDRNRACALASRAIVGACLAVVALCCGQAADAQDLPPELSEARFRQIHYQIFHDGQNPADCVAPSPSSGIDCTERAASDLPPLEMPPEAPAADSGFLPSSFGATRGTLAAAPNMIGDFFGGGSYIANALVSTAGGDRPFKLSDNWQPIPIDRVYFNYNHFNNVPTVITNSAVRVYNRSFDRYTMGIEKTFFGGMMSVDFRAPWISGLNGDQRLGLGTPPVQGTQFSNLAVATKLLLISRRRFALSTGLGTTFPTGNNFRLLDSSGTVELASMQNQSVHLQPFLGFVTTPGGRAFLQGVAQVDVDVNGNPVWLNGAGYGRIQAQPLLYTSLSGGVWIYENPCARLLSGVAPIIELHYTSTLKNTDQLSGQFSNILNRQDFLNLTGGTTFALGQRSYLTLAGTVPLRTFPGRGFNGETVIQYVRRY